MQNENPDHNSSSGGKSTESDVSDDQQHGLTVIEVNGALIEAYDGPRGRVVVGPIPATVPDDLDTDREEGDND